MPSENDGGNKRKRAPRTPAEINNSYNGSSRCIRCALRRRFCCFNEESMYPNRCLGCQYESDEIYCQPLGTSFFQYSNESKLGQRKACLCCFGRGKKCVYDNDDKWDYKSKCLYCTEKGKSCWPLVNFIGMRKHSSKLFSGVSDNFAVDNNLTELVASIVFQAASDFKETVDFPLNFDPIISTQRPACVRNNYGLVMDEKYCGNTLFQEIVSYGSGSGAISVGSTHNTNYLRPVTTEMKSLMTAVHSTLKKYGYLSPFLTQNFNHVEVSINGGKGLSNDVCSVIQTGSHTDVTYSYNKKTDSIQCLPSRNSQSENTIVAILTVGHSRILTFERVVWKSGPTDEVIETKYFLLQHNSLFVLHPLDERPTLRDSKSDILSFWRHGRVTLACTNETCTNQCNRTCYGKNKDIASFALALRCCSQSRWIDSMSFVEPLSDHTRSDLQLKPLDSNQKSRNKIAVEMLKQYHSDGGADTFNDWLLATTRRVMSDYYT